MADSDVGIMLTIIIIFVSLGVLTPFVRAGFEQSETSIDVEGFSNDLADEITPSTTGILSVASSIILMFFWTFGNIPALLDLLLFVPMRLILGWMIVRVVRGV